MFSSLFFLFIKMIFRLQQIKTQFNFLEGFYITSDQ